jgi:hypothetical protein
VRVCEVAGGGEEENEISCMTKGMHELGIMLLAVYTRKSSKSKVNYICETTKYYAQCMIFTARNKIQSICCICHTGTRNAGFCGKCVFVD